MALTVERVTALDDDLAAAVRELADSVEERDGAPPLSDQALTQLHGTQAQHAVARADGSLTGYAQLAGSSLEIVGDESAAGALVDELGSAPGLLVWSHGSRTPLAPALESRGFTRQRILHQLRRTLDAPPTPEPLADGITVRAFVPGRDEDAWLRVNAAAFAHHPEQGGWQRPDIEAREAEGWFDPAGFLLAERAGRLLGYHWTKVHPDGAGEVYVLGVDPAAQGLRLGAALLDRGLAHLYAHGCREVLLYVDDDNTAAMRLYERAGFGRYDVDIQWAR